VDATAAPIALAPRARDAWARWTDRTTERGLVRVVTINTHRGRGPILPYLLGRADPDEEQRIRLLHDTRAYAWHIAEWVRRHVDRYHAVGLQEVFHGVLGGLPGRLAGRAPQLAYYRALAGYPHTIAHRVGFSAFRYENVLLSRLVRSDDPGHHVRLPGRVFRLAACGFTLTPFRVEDRTVWVGNTHLHAFNPRARTVQAESIVREIGRLGDVPVILLGDLNAVPPGCRDGDFAHGDREAFWTYPTGRPNRTLDYVLFSRHWQVARYRVVREFTLSDHYPVEAELLLVQEGRGPRGAGSPAAR